MRIEAVETLVVALPLRSPWHTIAGAMHERETLLVRVRTDVGDGWGECAAFARPGYSPEFVASARLVIDELLALAAPEADAAAVASLLAPISGHRMAKSAVEMAVLDAELRAAGVSFAEWLGVTRSTVPAGVALGFMSSTEELLDRVAAFVGERYDRVKLKVAPGRDVDVVATVRERFPDLALQVDANGAYDADDPDHMARLVELDRYGLDLIEQPFGDDDLIGHARLAERLGTPVCLDEPIVSLDTLRAAVAVGACEVVNLKPGRVGGYLEARRIHDWCAGHAPAPVPLWCGGMLETGLARAANVALAALDGFTLTGDLSASSRFYEHDIVAEPITVVDGRIAVPTVPGMGAEPDLDAIERFRIA